MCVHTSQLFPNLSLLNLEIIILAKRSYDPINQKHANEAEPACLVETRGGGGGNTSIYLTGMLVREQISTTQKNRMTLTSYPKKIEWLKMQCLSKFE